MSTLIKHYLIVLFLLFFSLTTSAGTLYGVDRGNDRLVSVNTTTYVATVIGNLGTNEEFGGLAYDSVNDIMYLSGGRGNTSIYTVNYTTGVATLLGGHGIPDLFGLAFDSTNNVLYGISNSNSNLYSFSLINGSATLIGNTGFNVGGLAYDSTRDRLVGITTGGGEIFDINRTTASSTSLLAGLSVLNDLGFTYDYENDLFYSYNLSGFLHDYDPITFARTQRATSLPPC